MTLAELKPTRPVLRYHGGKWRIAPWVIAHLPPHRVYVEPFGGAGSVLLRKPRSFAEVYNDLDGDVVNVFRVLRDPEGADRLRRAVALTPYARAEFYAAYEETDEPIERARRTIVRSFLAHGTTSRRRNRTGFRGQAYRESQTGSHDWAGWPDCIPAYVDRLRGVVIECRDAREVIAQQDREDTLFFVDPPYVLSTRSGVRTASDRDRCYAYDMDDAAHRALAEQLHRLRGLVVLSGYPSDLYDELYGSWHRVEKRSIVDGGGSRIEVLWLSPRTAELLGSNVPLFAGAKAGAA